MLSGADQAALASIDSAVVVQHHEDAVAGGSWAHLAGAPRRQPRTELAQRDPETRGRGGAAPAWECPESPVATWFG